MDREATPARRASPFVALIIAACIVLVVVDAALMLRNRTLSTQVLQLERAVLAAEGSGLATGQILPRTTLLDGAGDAIRVPDDGGGPTLLLISSDACDACKDVAALWEELARIADGTSLVVLGMVLDATPESLRTRTAPWPLLAPGLDAWPLVRRLPGVPTALLVDGDGNVLCAAFGAEQVGLREAVEGFLQRSQR